jgi:hypothetical protein
MIKIGGRGGGEKGFYRFISPFSEDDFYFAK